MKWEFSLNLKKIILLGFCFLLLSGLLVLTGYLYGLMSGSETARTGAATPQAAKDPAKPTAGASPTQNTVRQPLSVSEKAKDAPTDKPAVPAPPAGDKPDQTSAAPSKSEAPPPPAPAPPPAAPAPKEAPPQSEAPAKTDAPAGGDPAPPQNPAATPEKKKAAPAAKTAEAAPGQTPPPDAPTETWKEGYTVQVGSFTFEENAMEMIHKILNLNYPAYMYLYTDSKGGVWYVVQAGEYDHRGKAAETAAELEKKDMIALVKPITESIRQKRKAFTK